MKVFCVFSAFLFFASLSPARAGDLSRGCVPGRVTGYRAAYRAYRTGYFPNGSRMEGGFKDRHGHPLRTLQAYLRGQAPYVSVAMDLHDKRFPYGTRLRIPEVEEVFGTCIEFRVVDTGDRFLGKGSSKVDICNDTNAHAEASYSNGSATIYVINSLNDVSEQVGMELRSGSEEGNPVE